MVWEFLMIDFTRAANAVRDDWAFEQIFALASSFENEIGKPEAGVVIIRFSSVLFIHSQELEWNAMDRQNFVES